MSGHTQGPWEIKNNIGIYSGNRQLAVISSRIGDMNDEERANARLIAAAPELLDVLLTIQKYRAYEWSEMGSQQEHTLAAAIHSVIDKATGQ